MAVKYGKFELPAKIKVDEANKSNTYVRFIAEPFERGFGHTIGNALRRIMLNALEAPAIISVKIEGVQHEYMAVEGIVEDMTHIVLNLKGALLRKVPTDDENHSKDVKLISKVLEITPELLEKNAGTYAVTLKDLLGDSEFELVNGEMRVFTATKPQTRKINLRIAINRGYIPSERHVIANQLVEEIVIDSAFSPVRLVNYYVENTRVGQDTDYDRLILEVTTDGRITPEEAVSFATQIGVLHFEVFNKSKFQNSVSFERREEQLNTDRDTLLSKLALKINEIELSVRSTNCLSSANIDTIAELVLMPESDMLKFRNFGKKSLKEIQMKLEEMGLSLGMEVELKKLDITRENVKDEIAKHMKQHALGEV